MQRIRSVSTHRLRKTKAALLAVSLTLAGVLLITLSSWIAGLDLGAWDWLHALPIAELGGILFGAGVLSTLFEYSFRKDQEAATMEQFRHIIAEQAPAMRDAVVEGFAIRPDDLKQVATPELLDTIATNAMALRLGDEQFARELYADVRDQGVRASERWHDVDIRIRLSSIEESSTAGAARFDVTVQWEYTVVPSHPVQRFACVSDKDEFHELVMDTPATSTWYMTPRPGFRANERSAFELLEYSVDGEKLPIHRRARKTGQTYRVNIGEDFVREGKPVRINYVYRTITPQSGHLLYFSIDQPTKNVKVSLDYSTVDVATVVPLDLIASGQRSRISRLPAEVNGKSVTIDFDGWLLPRAGFAFVWTLGRELHEPSAVDVGTTADKAA